MMDRKVPAARKERVDYHATVRMQDLREHIVENLRRDYPKDLSSEDYYEIADEAIDKILALGETPAVHESINLYGLHLAREILAKTKGSIVSKL
ncbi:unnamed protein product [marine sediment metagenome]|uniref:Uncharacterized protein n=1 Tax=marine sediment metagenome TaxID=412755 RepID=X1W066_9ZZZZ